MAYEFASVTPPGPDLGHALATIGITASIGWRPNGFIIFGGIDESDQATITAINTFMGSYVPGPAPPMPPSLEERIAALETWRAGMEGG